MRKCGRYYWASKGNDGSIESEDFDTELTKDIIREAGQNGVSLVAPLTVIEKPGRLA